MKTNNRVAELEKNFSRMFWIQALMNLKILGVVISIFYIHRGLTLQQIFLLGVVFATSSVLLEIPSSYAADRWGRKKTIFVAVVLFALSSVFDFFAHDFLLFAIGIALYGATYSFMSGTDEAIIYDTTRELGRGKDSLKELGTYYSAQRFLKIITPLIGVVIAQDLLEWQFQTIIAIEFITTIAALPFVFSLVEPNYRVDSEKKEKGILRDAWKLIRGNSAMLHAMISRTIIFLASLLVWKIHQDYFVNHGVTILTLGFMWLVINATGYFAAKHVTRILPHMSSSRKIKILNIIFTGAISIFAVASFYAAPWLLVISFAILCIAEVVRWPMYSDMFNKLSKSFNRATTLSLTNLIKCAFDIPLALAAAWLVGFNPSYVFVLVTAISLGVVVFVPNKETV